jgi:hypothetical protein
MRRHANAVLLRSGFGVSFAPEKNIFLLYHAQARQRRTSSLRLRRKLRFEKGYFLPVSGAAGTPTPYFFVQVSA